MKFPVSGVEIHPAWPFLTAFVVSFCSSMGGVSGAFLLLPYQVSVLGFTSPAVSSTNLVFNILAIPGGVRRFSRDARMLWPLALCLVAGLVPGVCAGVFVRIRFLPDPRVFKLFVGVVLMLIGVRLVFDLLRRAAMSDPQACELGEIEAGPGRVTFRFGAASHGFRPALVVLLGLLVGVVSGAYGIGGGSLTAPILITLFGLPIHAIAGATLAGTFATSVIGITAYTWIAPHFVQDGVPTAPDWLLGGLLGLGGMAGIYLGARCQRFVPVRVIKAILVLVLLTVAVRYLV